MLGGPSFLSVLLPVADINTLAFATIVAIGPPGPEIETRGMMNAGNAVLVRVPPRVIAQLPDVWASPLISIVGRGVHQNLQSFVRGGIAVHMNKESLEIRFEFRDGGLGRAH